eukprot:UN28432
MYMFPLRSLADYQFALRKFRFSNERRTHTCLRCFLQTFPALLMIMYYVIEQELDVDPFVYFCIIVFSFNLALLKITDDFLGFETEPGMFDKTCLVILRGAEIVLKATILMLFAYSVSIFGAIIIYTFEMILVYWVLDQY